MKDFVIRRRKDEPPFNKQAAEELIEDNWWADHSRLQPAFGTSFHYECAVFSFLAMQRVEGYLWDDDGHIIGCAVYVRQLDIHHGLIASPITVIVKTEHRGNLNVTRRMQRLIRRVARETGATRYYHVTHLNEKVQIHKLRNV
ncbi:hypothetical protein [Cronobacter phage EspYZU13]|uniref:N-acetyltransferase domain-containing protein n=1 Tax=Cronobacter phage EspYZU13 TaxID=3003790 RepID=A0AAE9W2K6_9CAUD|nr:hypothetical protein [Cronobacter phage EspYZU13]